MPASASAVEAAPGGAAEEAAPGGAPAGALAKARYHGRHFVETMKQYWLGTKLLWLDVKTASGLVGRVARGYDLSRRERKQLLRTTADLIRVVPFAVFVVVPFLEFLLPVALAIFPGMLPSTFQDSTKKEEKAKATLRARLALAGFLGDALGEMREGAKSQKKSQESASASELSAFVAKARAGNIATADVTKFARTFGDELMLDNLPRAQLVNLCRYMGITPFGTDALLRFQLRSSIRALRQDDRRIVYEGLDSLTRQEMQEACADRGMRSVGLTKQQYRDQLDQWIELAANRQLPIALLIMSRAFTLDSATAKPPKAKAADTAAGVVHARVEPADLAERRMAESEKAIAESISGLDAALVDEAVANAASDDEAQSVEVKAKKLKVLMQQNKLIAEERKEAQKLEAEKQTKDKGAAVDDAATADAAPAAADAAKAAAKAAAPASASSPDAAPDARDDAPDAHLGSRVEAAFAADSAKALDRLFEATDGAAAPAAPAAPSDGPAAADAAAVDASEFSAKDKMEVAEVLVDMAYESALEREKDDLEELKEKLKKVPDDDGDDAFLHEPILASDAAVVEDALAPSAKDQVRLDAEADAFAAAARTSPDEPKAAQADADGADGRDGADADEKKDKKIAALEQKLASMTESIEKEIETIDVKLGDKLHFIDKDNDGAPPAPALFKVFFFPVSPRSTRDPPQASSTPRSSGKRSAPSRSARGSSPTTRSPSRSSSASPSRRWTSTATASSPSRRSRSGSRASRRSSRTPRSPTPPSARPEALKRKSYRSGAHEPCEILRRG